MKQFFLVKSNEKIKEEDTRTGDKYKQAKNIKRKQQYIKIEKTPKNLHI